MNYDDLTAEERIHLLINDWDTYKQIVPSERWYSLLDPLAKMKKETERKENESIHDTSTIQ